MDNPPSDAPPAGRRRAIVAVLIFTLAVLVRIAIAFATKEYRAPAYSEEVMVAQSVERSGVFGNPFQIPTGPTAHVAPLYPLVLAFILKLIPWGPGFKLVTIALGVLAASVMWAWLPACAVYLGLDYRTGVVAGLFGAIDPLHHQVELDGIWDTTLSALALLGLVVFTFRSRNRLYNPGTAVGLGCYWGAILLLQPAFLSILVPLAALFLCNSLREKRVARALQSVAVAAAAVVLTITPWLIRNDVALGGFTFIRDNFGLELDISNNNYAAPDLLHNLHLSKTANHPDIDLAENRRMAALGELNYYHQRQNQASAWIRANPGRFVKLTAERFFDYWVPQRRSVPLAAVELLITLAALFGLGLMIRQQKPVAVVFLVIWMFQPLVYYVIQADERYRYPIEWSIVMCAAYAAVSSLRTWKGVAFEDQR